MEFSNRQKPCDYGLNTREKVDAEIEFYPSGKKVKAPGLLANRTWVVGEDGGVKELPPPAPVENAGAPATQPAGK